MEKLGFAEQETPQQPVERLETGKKAFDFLDRVGLLEARKSDEQFEAFLQKTSYDEYKTYLTRLNGILREIPIHQRSIDGEDVEISFGVGQETLYIPPDENQKDPLMKEVFEAIKQISSNKDRALLVYYTIQAIHPYADGNGRTGRLLYELISEDGKNITEERLSQLLDHDNSSKQSVGNGRIDFTEKVTPPEMAYYWINRELAKEMLGEDFLKEYGSINYSGPIGVANVPSELNIPPSEKQLAEKIISEAGVGRFAFRSLAIVKLLQENNKLEKCRYEIKPTVKGATTEDNGKKVFGIDDEKFEASLNEEDVKRLIEIHKDMKRKFMKTMVDIFTQPDKHLIENSDKRKIPLKYALY